MTADEQTVFDTVLGSLAGEITLSRLDEPYTDADNAAIFAELMHDQIHYVHAWGRWIVYDGNHWKVDGNNALVFDAAKCVARYHADQWKAAAEGKIQMSGKEADRLASWARQSASRSRIDATASLARGLAGVFIDHTELDADPWKLHVANGRIDLKLGRWEGPDPKHLNTLLSPVDYDAYATAPTWERCLEEWHPDRDQREYLQRLIGEAVVGTVRDHILVIHYGGGANGKGTFVNALAYVLGSYFTVPHKSLLTMNRHEQHATVVASLFRTRLAVASEAASRVKLDEASIKNLTGGDTLRARRMREDEWSFEPTHSLHLQTNHLPEIAGTDEGIWRRVLVVPWLGSFKGSSEDPQLGEKLRREAPGILNWVIEGALKWQAEGLNQPASVQKASDDYRKDEDKVARFLADYRYQFGTGRNVRAKVIQGEWTEWSESVYGSVIRGHELAEGLRSGGAESKVVRITEFGARQQVTMWNGVGKNEESHLE